MVNGGGLIRLRGITLMELMIVLVIVGILAAIGIPGYVGYTNRAKRADGKALLMDASARQERFFFDRNAYTADTDDGLGYGSGAITSSEGHYTLQVTACPSGTINTCFLLTAVPVVADEDCGNLTLDSRGNQGQSGPRDAAFCWDR